MAPMKRSLRFVSIAFLLFAANASALKQPPPGAYGGQGAVLLMVENSYYTSMPSNEKDLPVEPSDVVIDSLGNLHVRNHNWSHGSNYTTTDHWMTPGYGNQCSIYKTCYPKDARISKFNPDLSAVATYGESLVGRDTFGNSTKKHTHSHRGAGDMAIDSSDNIYALIRSENAGNEWKTSTARIDKYDAAGVLIASIPLSNDKKAYEIGGDPRAIDVDGAGNIWVAGVMGLSSKRVWGYVTKYDPNGVVLTEWELPAGDGEYSGWAPNWWVRSQYYNRAEGQLGVPKAISVYGGKAYVLRSWTSYGPDRPLRWPYPKFLGKWDAITNSEFPYPECQIGFPVEVFSTATGAQLSSWYALGGDDIEVNANGVYVVGHKTFHTKHTREQNNNVGDADASLQYLWDDPIDLNNDGVPDVRYGPDCGGQVGKYSHSGALQLRFASRKIYCDESTVATPAALGSDADGNIYVVASQEQGPEQYPGYIEKHIYAPFSGIKKYSADGDYLGTTMSHSRAREDHIKCALRKILAKPELTSNIKLGFQIFNQDPKMLTGVSSSGASEIRPMLCQRCPIDPRWRNKRTDSWYHTMGADGWTAYDMQGLQTQTNNLYEALDYAKSYYSNALPGFPSPIDPTSCESHSVLLISSTPWPWEDAKFTTWATAMEALGVQTHVIGYALPELAWTAPNHGGSWCYKANRCATAEEDFQSYEKLAKLGKTYPTSPRLVDSNGLVDAIETILLASRKSDLVFTGTAPAIAPPAVGDYIYQSTFTLPGAGQWRGKLTKYAHDSTTGAIGDQIWEAGAQLNLKSANDRRIWTARSGVAPGLNNFAVPNVTSLKAIMYAGVDPAPTDDEAGKLINFVRGQDCYDEDYDGNVTCAADERDWKLGDIYHSEMAIVGPPDAIDPDLAADTNTEEYFKSQNGYQTFIDANASRETMVYVGANDGMLHAFKDSTGEELWAFIPPNVLPKLRSMISGVAHVTLPIYGVDGSPVVKDVLLGGQWRTVLMAGLGREGYGYFALDVTNPSSPSFLFAFENDPQKEVVRHWNSQGNLTEQNYTRTSSYFNYRNLGEALSTPTIVLVTDGGSRKWVAAIGGGLNNTDDKNYGSAVYLIDIGDVGKVLRVIDLADMSGGFKNSHPAPLTAVTSDTTSLATYKGARLYSVDRESRVYKINQCNVESASPCVSASTRDQTMLIGNAGNDLNQRASFNAVTPTTDSDDKLWVYFGTGNLDKLQLSQATIQNRILGIKDSSFPAVTKGGGVSMGSPTIKNVTGAGATCPSASDDGWYLDLGRDEKVVSKIALDKQILYAPVYKPDTTQPCFPGTSTLYQMGYACGKVLKKTSMGAGLIAGVRIHQDKVYVGISGTPDNQTEVDLGDGYKKKGSIAFGSPPAAANPVGEVITIESWREKY